MVAHTDSPLPAAKATTLAVQSRALSRALLKFRV